MLPSTSLREKWLRIEFEIRIFISLGIVAVICLINFAGFPQLPGNMELLGRLFGWTKEFSVTAGFLFVAFLMVIASLLRMWSGTVLSSSLVMSFKIQKDVLSREGPYQLSRNPIYLADLLAMSSFALCLSPVGLVMPLLFFWHYSRLIEYEETSLASQFGAEFQDFKKQTPRFLPNLRSLRRLGSALSDFRINYDGFRHDALYLLFIPGFIVAAFTGRLIYAVVIGLPAVIDWAIVHTKIGLNPDGSRQKKAEPAAKLKQSKVFSDIIYAQCWEDPEMDRRAFNTSPDDVVFSVTSGGCNMLAFLADDPKKVIALDLSPYQNFLLELKMAAFRSLGYEELLAFLGVTDSPERLKMYGWLKPDLTPECREYWDGQPQKIRMGVIHSGRYEKYMRLLKKWMTLLVGKSLPEELFACQTRAERLELYDRKWNNFRWRFFTKIFLSRRMMSLLFTDKFFDQLDADFSFGEHFRRKIERAVTELPLRENYFLAYTLLGRFYDLKNLPVYLRRENFDKIKSRLDRIEIVTGPCETYFQSLPPGSVSKFNFTNIFEWMEPAAFENLLRETIRVASDGAVITYRNLLVPRSRPASLARWIEPQTALAKELLDADRSFIYRAYNVEKIVKTEAIADRVRLDVKSQAAETVL
jgi:S-adenosylmethionine-diacylglycerol 3-amino-3-carboxypropyl transferase